MKTPENKIRLDTIYLTKFPTHLVRTIMKTRPCNIQIFFFGFKNENFHRKRFDIFLIFAQNIDCGYLLEPPRRGGSNEYPQSMFWSKNKKNIENFLMKFSIFVTEKNYPYIIWASFRNEHADRCTQRSFRSD